MVLSATLLKQARNFLAVPLALALAPQTTVAAFQPHLRSHPHRFFATTTLSTSSAASFGSSQLYTHPRNFQKTSPSFLRMASTTTTDASSSAANVKLMPGNPTWHQTMLRVRDADASLRFYRDVLGLTHIDTLDFPQYKFSLHFLATLPADGEEPYALTPGTQEAHDFLWTYPGVTLELTHNHGTENDKDFAGYHIGNEEKDGFGHIAVNVPDVYATSDKLLQLGIPFKKKPDEGRMKGLAFCKDPDGYWVEIVKRGESATIPNDMNFSQTMLRVKDPKKSLEFYRSLGMKLLSERHFDSFSLYFLGSGNVDESIPMKDQFQPVLELTHNHGTENDEDFKHYNGNEEGRQGFGHIGFLTDDVYATCDALRDTFPYGFRKEPDGGSMKGLAFAYDPDGYSVEIIKRGGIDFGDAKKTK